MKRSCALLWAVLLSAQAAAPETQVVPAAPPPAPSAIKPTSAPARTRMAAAAQRNENVAVQQIDTNAAKEANIRVGTRATVSQFSALDSTYYAAEHGQVAAELLAPTATSRRTGWHGEAFWNHQNSVFNARTFFQVGPVRPSRRNVYGFRGTADAGPRP